MAQTLDSRTILIPVGIPLGVRFTEGADPDDIDSENALIRRGARQFLLTPRDYAVWSLCFHVSSVARLRDALDEVEIESPDKTIDSLLNMGLLIDLGRPEKRTELFRAHRLLPAGTGLGNRPDLIGEYVITNGDDIVQVDVATYFTWARSNTAPSLAVACKETADELQQRITPENVTDVMVAALPQLIRARVAFLDAAIGLAAPPSAAAAVGSASRGFAPRPMPPASGPPPAGFTPQPYPPRST